VTNRDESIFSLWGTQIIKVSYFHFDASVKAENNIRRPCLQHDLLAFGPVCGDQHKKKLTS
jgi:hypothetical protein